MVGIFPHLPQAEEIILTTFWIENFDMTNDKQCGAGAVNTTHLVAFQESAGLPNTINITMPRSKKRKRSVLPSTNHSVNKINVSVEPQKFVEIATESSSDKSLFESLHYLWLYLWKQNAYDQILPIFSGWLVRQRMKEIPKTALKKTTETYLPPITSKVIDFETISNYITYLKSLASECNMPYVNKRFDVGAATNAFNFIWNDPVRHNDVMIHFGRFPLYKREFSGELFLMITFIF